MNYSKLFVISCLLYMYTESLPLGHENYDELFWHTEIRLCEDQLENMAKRVCPNNGQHNFLAS